MIDNPPENITPLDEELVAYLDGELDAESGRRIEALLASDPVVRRRLQSLERTWDLLDELDVAPLGEPFTQTTLEMVAIAARQDAEQSRAEAPRRRRRWRLAVGAGLLAAAAAGFCAVALYNPDRQLLQDLPLLENLDEYRQIGSIEFLRRLRDERLFPAKNAEDLRKAPATDNEDLAARRQRVESMNLDQKERLLRAEDRFLALAPAPAEQQRLRRLHGDLLNDHDAPQLRAIMHAYYEWLKPLSELTWTDLAYGETDERIAAVKKLQAEQQREGGRRPDPKDMLALRNWMDECETRHEAEFLKSLPTELARKMFVEAPKQRQVQVMFGSLLWRGPGSIAGKLPPGMTDDDLTRLREKLGPDMRKQLEEKKPVDQWRLVAAWMRQVFHHPFEDRRMRVPLPPNADEALAEFFEKLSNEERDRLLSLPGEEIQGAVQQMYFRNRPPEGPNRRNRRPDGPERPLPDKSGSPPRIPLSKPN